MHVSMCDQATERIERMLVISERKKEASYKERGRRAGEWEAIERNVFTVHEMRRNMRVSEGVGGKGKVGGAGIRTGAWEHMTGE